MSRWMKILAAFLLAVGGSLVTASAASASVADLPACEQEAQGYSPETPCQLLVETSAQCLQAVPWISFDATVEGTTATSMTITFVNPTGDDVVLTNQPLSGWVLWPGAAVDADGNPTSWPGWTQLESGEWIEAGEYDWTRPALTATFEVNPIAEVTIQYPPATAACAGPIDVGSATPISNPVTTATPTAVLSETGATVAPLLAAAAGLVGLGALALIGTRRRAAQH